jgi:hypothetical protein
MCVGGGEDGLDAAVLGGVGGMGAQVVAERGQ